MISTKGDKFHAIISLLWKVECVIKPSVPHVQDMFEDTNGVIRSRKFVIGRQYNYQKKTRNRTIGQIMIYRYNAEN